MELFILMIIRNFTSNLFLNFFYILNLQIALSFELVHLLECIRSANILIIYFSTKITGRWPQ
jgi:hypothetical protein